MSIFDEKEYDMLVIKVGIKVGYYRRLCNMTQEQLSEYAEMSLNFISQLEAPSIVYVPSIKSLYKIAKALGVPVSKLLEVDE